MNLNLSYISIFVIIIACVISIISIILVCTLNINTNDSWNNNGAKNTILGQNIGSGYEGLSIAVNSAGDTLVSGCYGYNGFKGAAFVYKLINNNTWTNTPVQILTRQLSAANEGYCVAISGNGNIIGTGIPNYNNGGINIYTKNSDELYIFTILLTQNILTSEEGSCFKFDYEGIRLISGVRGYNTGAGGAFIYVNSNNTWSNTPEATLTQGFSTDSYEGYSVDINYDGSVVVLGSPDYLSVQGCVTIYKRTNTTWSFIILLTNTTSIYVNSHQGTSVSINNSGSIIAVGCPQSHGQTTSNGSVIVYFDNNNNNTWSKQIIASLGSSIPDYYDGDNVVISNDGKLLGSYTLFSSNGMNDSFFSRSIIYELQNDIYIVSAILTSNTILVDPQLNNNSIQFPRFQNKNQIKTVFTGENSYGNASNFGRNVIYSFD